MREKGRKREKDREKKSKVIVDGGSGLGNFRRRNII